MKRRRSLLNIRWIDVNAKRTPKEAATKAALDRAAGDQYAAEVLAALKAVDARRAAEDAAAAK